MKAHTLPPSPQPLCTVAVQPQLQSPLATVHTWCDKLTPSEALMCVDNMCQHTQLVLNSTPTGAQGAKQGEHTRQPCR